MRLLRRLWAGVRNAWRAATWVFWDRELTLLVLVGISGLVAGAFDRLFKKRGEKW